MLKELGFCRVKGLGIPDAPESEKAPAPRPVAWDDINPAEKCLLFRYIESGGEELSLTPLERTVPEMVQARRELYRTMIRRYEGALTRHFEADVATEIVAGLTTLIEMAVVEKVRTAIGSCGAENPTMRRGSHHEASALRAALHQVGVLDATKVTYPGWWVVQTSCGASFVHHNPHHDVLGGFWTEPHIPTAMSRAAAQRRCDAWNSIVLDPRNGLDPVQDLGRVVELDSSRRVAEKQLCEGRMLEDSEPCLDKIVEFRSQDGRLFRGRITHPSHPLAAEPAVLVDVGGPSWVVPRSRCVLPTAQSDVAYRPR